MSAGSGGDTELMFMDLAILCLTYNKQMTGALSGRHHFEFFLEVVHSVESYITVVALLKLLAQILDSASRFPFLHSSINSAH